MHPCASNLAQLLESDLLSSGWHNPAEFVGPERPHERLLAVVGEAIHRSLLKKFIPYEETADEPTSPRNVKALDLFLQSNEECRTWEYRPDGEDVAIAIEEAKSILDGFCHPHGDGVLLTLGSIAQAFDLGPGANVETDNVDFYTKAFSSPLSCTSIGLAKLYSHAIRGNETWSLAESNREKVFGTLIVPGNRIAFALKNREIGRTIGSEPTGNMMFQKGEQFVLEGRCKQVFGIDLSTQQFKNRELARLGSIFDSYCTTDMKSASDLNSRRMISFMFPADLVRWLDRTRSPFAILPDGSCVELHMVSSMGNAFTFPLMTVLFASIVVACYKVLGIKVKLPRGKRLGNFAVFGDDIIVVKEANNLVNRCLAALGHKVNHDKSFSEGPFRESCGSDWYSGHNVRGVYIKALNDDCDIYSAVNRLNRWSSFHGIPLPLTTQYLLSCLKGKNGLNKPYLVPMHEQDTAGLKVCEDDVRGKLKFKLHGGRQYRCLVPVTYKLDLSDESALKSQVLNASLRKALKMRMNPKEKYLSKFKYNPEGILLLASASRLRDRSIVIREFRRRTCVKVRYSPCWDYTGPDAEETLRRLRTYERNQWPNKVT